MSAPSNGLQAANAARAKQQQVRALVHGLGNALGSKRRGLSPVLRHSSHAGDAELRKWREHNVFPRVEKEIALEQIFRWADEHKEKGRAWGLLTPKQKDILRILYDARDYVTGRLDFAYSHLCRLARCCSQTLSVAIKRFEELKLIEKWRRTVPVDDPVPDGPRVLQINNAYFLKRPGEVASRIRAKLARIGAALLPATMVGRDPSPHERQALAAQTARSNSAGPADAARQERYAHDMWLKINARSNAPRTKERDSSV